MGDCDHPFSDGSFARLTLECAMKKNFVGSPTPEAENAPLRHAACNPPLTLESVLMLNSKESKTDKDSWKEIITLFLVFPFCDLWSAGAHSNTTGLYRSVLFVFLYVYLYDSLCGGCTAYTDDASAIARRALAAHGTFPERGPGTNSLPHNLIWQEAPADVPREVMRGKSCTCTGTLLNMRTQSPLNKFESKKGTSVVGRHPGRGLSVPHEARSERFSPTKIQSWSGFVAPKEGRLIQSQKPIGKFTQDRTWNFLVLTRRHLTTEPPSLLSLITSGEHVKAQGRIQPSSPWRSHVLGSVRAGFDSILKSKTKIQPGEVVTP
ncbi:hypothetical protein EVAR_28578_1 [Eumeta japonica]|uniref:Uncharacterized protein n=1 Tax=Eumeta variegata TaxID=151549 RepID=A0A4C1UY55_EUMVA|nr:hypothetical protein EVAR_28578_1 [Eumeta japonica]